MNDKTLLIAPIGDPTRYREATYKSNNEIKSCLSFLSHEADRVIVVGLSSMLDTYPTGINSSCARIMNELVKRVGNVKEYSILHEKAKASLYEFVYRMLEEAGKKDVEFDVVILPALGKPGSKYSFAFHPSTITSLLLAQIYLKLDEEEFYSKIIVDLSHGINYTPVACSMVASQIAQLMLIRSLERENQQIKVKTYNSDPFKENEVLNLNITSERGIQILANNLIEFLSRGESCMELGEPQSPSNEPIQKIINEINKLKSKAEDLLKSMEYPYPLALAYLASGYEGIDLKSLLEKLVYYFINSVKSENYNFSSNIIINPSKLFLIILANEIRNYVSRIVKWKTSGFDLDSIEKLAKLYGKVIPSYEVLIKHEISRIKENVKKVEKIEGTLEEFFAEGKPEETSISEKQVSKRIMIAHAGFQKQFVWVNKINGIKLSYYYNGKVLSINDLDLNELVKWILHPSA